MKRILLKIMLVFAFIGAILISSCEVEPPTPDCELNNYGSVTVKNSTGYNVWVDVTWGNVIENYEKLLYKGNSHKYSKVPAGRIEIWVSFDGNDWYYEYESLSACEDMTYTWYLTGKKSTGCPFILDVGNGVLVEPTLGVKE